MSGNGKKKQLFLFIHYSPFITIEKKQMFMFKVCRKMCICVLFNLDCRSKSILHLKNFFVIHKCTVALCLRLCLFFCTFYRKYAYSCYAYKKKLVHLFPQMFSLSIDALKGASYYPQNTCFGFTYATIKTVMLL